MAVTKFSSGWNSNNPRPTVTATTGSPTIDTSSRPGKTIYKFTANGSITIGSPGLAEVLVVGPGGQSARGGAGGGQIVYNASMYLKAGTLPIYLGSAGSTTRLGDISAASGGNGWSDTGNGTNGESVGGNGANGGGGNARNQQIDAIIAGGSPIFSDQGYAGGNGQDAAGQWFYGGGGGGAGGAGGNVTSRGGNGGPGAPYSITGTTVYYAAGTAGGGGSGQTSGTGWGANTGSGDNAGIVVIVIG
jgi:hypothetical protein